MSAEAGVGAVLSLGGSWQRYGPRITRQCSGPAAGRYDVFASRSCGSATDRHYVMQREAATDRSDALRGRGALRVVFALAMLTCVAAVGSWVRSHVVADQVGWIADSWGLVADSDSGIVSFTFSANPNEVGRMQFQAGSGFMHFAKRPSDYAATFTSWRNIGFGYENDGRSRELTIPYYATTIVTGLLALWIAWRMFCTRLRPNWCPSCGYDLRATPDRCPECGREVQKGRAAAA